MMLLVQELALTDKLLSYGLPGFTILLVAGFLYHMRDERKSSEVARKEEREASDLRAKEIQTVFLAHNKDIADRCEERTAILVAKVVESNERHESALRDLAIEIRNARPVPTRPA